MTSEPSCKGEGAFAQRETSVSVEAFSPLLWRLGPSRALMSRRRSQMLDMYWCSARLSSRRVSLRFTESREYLEMFRGTQTEKRKRGFTLIWTTVWSSSTSSPHRLSTQSCVLGSGPQAHPTSQCLGIARLVYYDSKADAMGDVQVDYWRRTYMDIMVWRVLIYAYLIW